MAVVKPGDLARFLERGWKSWSVVLLHGSDEGLIRETADRLVALAAGPGADPMSVVDLDGEAIAKDPARLADELRAFGLFGGSRVVHLRSAARAPAAALEAAIDDTVPGTFLLLEAGELKKGAGLRGLAERSPNVAVLACYADNQQAIQRLIHEVLGQRGFNLSNEAKEALVAALGNDRALSRSELEKLALFAGETREIDASMVAEIVSDAGRHEISGLIDQAFVGDIREIETEANRLFASGTNPAGLLSQSIGHVLLLRRVVRGGGEAALHQARLHFSRLPLATRAANLWSEARLERALKNLSDAVLQSRRSSRLAESIAIRALWSISRMAKNEAG